MQHDRVAVAKRYIVEIIGQSRRWLFPERLVRVVLMGKGLDQFELLLFPQVDTWNGSRYFEDILAMISNFL